MNAIQGNGTRASRWRIRGRSPKLLPRLRLELRSHHYSPRTERACWHWVKRYVYFHGVRHPAEMAEPQINAFLKHLAVKENVSALTQNQALSALLFLYRHVLDREIGDLGEIVRARKPKRLPVVMIRDEVKAVLASLSSDKWLMASLMYGTGPRLMECLRVQDLDSSRNEILVRNGKGAKDRITMRPESVRAPLEDHLERVRTVHERDVAAGLGTCRDGRCPGPQIPKRSERMALAMGFSARKPLEEHQDRGGGSALRSRNDIAGSRQGSRSRERRGQTRRLPCLPALLRHSSARGGYDIRTIQELLGHKDVSTTTIYTHVLNKGGHGVRRPMDAL